MCLNGQKFWPHLLRRLFTDFLGHTLWTWNQIWVHILQIWSCSKMRHEVNESNAIKLCCRILPIFGRKSALGWKVLASSLIYEIINDQIWQGESKEQRLFHNELAMYEYSRLISEICKINSHSHNTVLSFCTYNRGS